MNMTAETFGQPTHLRQEPGPPSRAGWSAAASTALVVVLGEPRLWLIGTAGFLLRGGWLVLGIPLWAVPSPVGISTIIGPDAFTAAGASARLIATLAAVSAGLVVVLAACAALAAWVELTAYERFVADPEVAPLLRGQQPHPPHGRRRAGVLLELIGIQGAVFLPAGLAIVASLVAMAGSLRTEMEFPTSYEVPLLLRIAFANVTPVAAAACLLVLGDAASALLGRRRLARSFGLERSVGVRGATRPGAAGPILGTFICGWAATAVLVVPPLAAVLVAWAGVRSAFLSPPLTPEFGLIAGWALVTVLFVALWCAAALLGGLASAFRAALWSAVALR